MTEIETETKLTVSAADYETIRRRGRVLECREQLNIYLHDPERLQEGLGYFRVRFETGKAPVATLKIPMGWDEGIRTMVEMEKPLEAMGPGLFPRPGRIVEVAEDLPPEMAGHFLALDITRLRRLGWMRNRRCLVASGEEGVLELDRTTLPDGSVHFEVEIETSEKEVRAALTARVLEWAPSARISRLGKFSRFLEVVAASQRRLRDPSR